MDYSSRVTRCSVAGALSGLIYAEVEALFLVVLPWIFQPGDLYQRLHFWATAATFVVYPFVGALAASIVFVPCWFLLRKNVSRVESLASASGLIALVALFGINAGRYLNNGRVVQCILFAGLCLLMAALLRVIAPRRSAALIFLANPWTASFMFVGLAMAPKLFGAAPRTAALGAYMIGLGVCSFVATTCLTRRSSSYRRFVAVAAAIAIGGTGLALGAALDTGLYVRFPNSGKVTAIYKRPNVILITLDTVRADHMSLYGYSRDTTPNLKRLGEEATVYLAATSSEAWTLPSHASIFTGLTPAHHGVVCDSKESFLRLGDEQETLAEQLKRGGYSTAGVAANITMLLRSFNLHQGFDYYAVRVPPRPYDTNSHLVLRDWYGALVGVLVKPGRNPELYRRAEDINREVFPLIDQLQSLSKPFFLFVNYMDVHTPYNPLPPYDSLFTTAQGETMDLAEYYRVSNDVMKLTRKLPDAVSEQLAARYDGELAYLDYHMGRLVDYLRSRKLLENTLLIITSDHGEAFGDRNLMEHGVSVYQNQIHVPLLIRWPGTAHAERIQQPVSLIDIFPTVLGTLGLPVPRALAGQTLTKGHPPELRLVVAERYPCSELYHLHPRFHAVQRAAIWDRWKLIEAAGAKPELYEVADEGEKIDQAASDASRVVQIEHQLAAWLEHEKSRSGKSAGPAALTSDEIDRLKSLGYVQ